MVKSVLVTGAGSGLGLELARLYDQKGWKVFALTRTVYPSLSGLSNVTTIQCDIADTASVKDAIKQVSEQTRYLDLVFNNAGIHRFSDWVALEDTDLDACLEMFSINAVGPLRVVKESIPLLRKGSAIINISSEAASIENTHGVINYSYSMSKAAMNMGARIMDNWLSGRGIRTLMIHPGRMLTAMKGAHSTLEPAYVAGKIAGLVEHINEIPEENKFIDYLGNKLAW